MQKLSQSMTGIPLTGCHWEPNRNSSIMPFQLHRDGDARRAADHWAASPRGPRRPPRATEESMHPHHSLPHRFLLAAETRVTNHTPADGDAAMMTSCQITTEEINLHINTAKKISTSIFGLVSTLKTDNRAQTFKNWANLLDLIKLSLWNWFKTLSIFTRINLISLIVTKDHLFSFFSVVQIF